MTRHAIYSLQDNALTEQPQLSQPVLSVGGIFSPYAEIDRRRLVAYNKHIATLRTIPCSPGCRGLFENGKVYEEGKDYEVRDQLCPRHQILHEGGDCEYCIMEAYPLPVKSEQGVDDLWRSLILENFNDTEHDYSDEYIVLKIAKLKLQYIITKR